MHAPRTFAIASAPFVVAVADGLGGHARGDLASNIALTRLAAITSDNVERLTESSLSEIIQTVHQDLVDMAELSAKYRGMGTTIAGIVFQSNKALAFNVGDSRVYRREGDYLQIISVDDRMPGERGFGEASAGSTSNILLQCLGVGTTSAPPTPHFSTVALGATDTFLLCTDGLFDCLSLDEIEAAVRRPDGESLEGLIAATLAAGAPDNVTIVEIKVIANDDAS